MTLGELQRVLSEEELAAFGIAAEGENRRHALLLEVEPDTGPDRDGDLIY